MDDPRLGSISHELASLPYGVALRLLDGEIYTAGPDDDPDLYIVDVQPGETPEAAAKRYWLEIGKDPFTLCGLSPVDPQVVP